MSALITIDRSLVVRSGAATYQFNRLIDRSNVQLENQHTGQYVNMSMQAFHDRIRLGDYVVIGGQDHEHGAPPPQHAILDTSQLPDDEKERLDFKTRIQRFLRRKGVRRGSRNRIAEETFKIVDGLNKKRQSEGKPPFRLPSASAVMNWMRQLDAAGGSAAALVRQKTARPSELSEKVEQLVDWSLEKFYLTTDRFTLKYTYERLTAKLQHEVGNGKLTTAEAAVSYSTLSRRKDEIDPYLILKRRFGPSAAKHHFRATYDGTRVVRALQRVEIDHTLLNWVVTCDRTGLPLGRPTLTVVIDSYSGYVVGLYVSFNGPGVVSVLKAVKNSILPKDELVLDAGCTHPWIAWGIPDTIIVDNGLEFHSQVFRHVQWELSTDVEYCAVRQPWLKPHVERCLLDLDVIPVSQGRVRKPEPNVLPISPSECAVVPLSRFARGLVLWACDRYGFQFNHRRLAKPFDLFRDSMLRASAVTMPVSLAGLDLIAAMRKDLVVGNGGVELRGLSFAGLHLGDLLKAAGGRHRTAVRWDPDNMGFVYAQHCRSKEWLPLACTRPDFANGLTWNQLLVIRKALRADGLQGSVENMARTMERLREIWLEPLARKNVKVEQQQAKQFARVSAGSTPVLDPVRDPEHRLVVESADAGQDIPEFDTGEIY